MPPATLLVFNPRAGGNLPQRRRQLTRLAAGLEAGGWKIEIAEGQPRALEGYAAAVSCGGDGTLHHLLQRVMALAPEARPALAVAPPAGTANVMAQALGAPRNPEAAARWLLRSRPCLMPLGRAETSAGARYFATLASAGYDAAIVHRLEGSAAKRRWGKLAFAVAALTGWRRYFPAPLALEAAGRGFAADGVVVGLTQYYAGRGRLGQPAPHAIALALAGAPRWLAVQALCLATIGLERAPRVTRLPPGPVAITTPGIPLELDGEAWGHTPARLSVEPAAVTFLAPGPLY